MQDIVRDGKKPQLDGARRRYWDAEERLQAVRDGYPSELKSFLDARRNRDVTGTRTEFDGACFLVYSRASHELKIAMEEYDFTKKEAQGAGVLAARYLTSDFGYPSDDGYDVRSDRHGLLCELEREVIELWRNDERQREAASQGGWKVEAPAREPGGKSISIFSADSLGQLALGRRRKLIDEWKAHQDRLRADLRSVPPRSENVGYAQDEPERYWFQRWFGL